MKKILCFCLIVFSLASCRTYYIKVDKRLESFANDVIEHPEKLRDIKNNYPEYYNEKYIDESLLTSSYVSRLISYINNEYKKIDEGIIICDASYSNASIKYLNSISRKKYDFTSDEVIGFAFYKEKANRGVEFAIIHPDSSHFYIFKIGKFFIAEL
jgi:hypothetical protein